MFFLLHLCQCKIVGYFYDHTPFGLHVNVTVLLIVLDNAPSEVYCFAVTLALALLPLLDVFALLNFYVKK